MLFLDPRHRLVVIRPSKSASLDDDPEALYEATRRWWRLAQARTDGGQTSPTHALAVVSGHVAAAYEIEAWEQRPVDGRWSFTGHAATGPVSAYLGGDVRHLFPPGSANPVRFFGCAGSDAAATPAVVTRPRTRSVADEVSDLVAVIDAEPLAHVMFGHRELFHSNLLAWFFEALPEAADRVFGADLPAGEQTERRVERERQHLDLVVTMPGRERLVIENKVFSVYDAEQLEDYATVVAGWEGRSRLVLLSVLSPTEDPTWREGIFPCADGEWHYLSYDELAGRILDALDGAGEAYEVETMRRYARLVRALHRLVLAVGVQSSQEPVALPPATVAALGTQQLAGSMVKLRARRIAQIVGTALVQDGAGGVAGSGYTNTQPIVEWFTDAVDEGGTTVTVGWQLQGAAFRRYVVLEHLAGRTAASRQERYDYAAAHGQWFDFAVTDEVLGTADTSIAPAVTAARPHGFNRYDPDFVYRSKAVPALTVGQLVGAALAVARSLEVRSAG